MTRGQPIQASTAVRTALKQAGPVTRILRQLDREGIDPSSRSGELRVFTLLSENSPHARCRCGATLAVWEAMNGRCASCLDGELARIEESHKPPSKAELAEVPTRYRVYTLENWRDDGWTEDQKDALVQWAIRPEENLLILGDRGTGKTHLATALFLSALSGGYRGRWFNSGRLASLLLAEREVKSGVTYTLVAETQILLLDDYRSSNENPLGLEIVDAVIDARYQEQLPVVATTNQTAEQLEGLHLPAGDSRKIKLARIYSRLQSGLVHERSLKEHGQRGER